MPQLIFFFGRNPVLSLAELASVLRVQFPAAPVQPVWNNAALIDFFPGNPVGLIKLLGGTTKIAQVVIELPELVPEKLLKELEEKRFFTKLGDKFFFALSVLGKVTEKEQAGALKALKRGFKQNKQKAQFKHGTVRKQQNQLVTNPTEVLSWDLLQTQTDLTIAKTSEGFFVCQTVAVANPEHWKQRDEMRPKKDNKEIVSIRLAKILLNLAELKQGQTILDPFCGFGTILQEAQLNGLNAIGTEKDSSKAQAAQQNLAWLTKQWVVSTQARVIQADAAQLSRVLKRGDFDAVVTEPYLGPYLKIKPGAQQARSILKELEPLYQKLFFELSALLVSGSRVVILLPAFETRGTMLRVSSRVFSLWFFSINPLKGFDIRFEKAFPFAYQNPKNKLLREIWVLQRK